MIHSGREIYKIELLGTSNRNDAVANAEFLIGCIDRNCTGGCRKLTAVLEFPSEKSPTANVSTEISIKAPPRFYLYQWCHTSQTYRRFILYGDKMQLLRH